MFDPGKMPLPTNAEDGCEIGKPKCIPDFVPLTLEGPGTFIAIYYGLIKEVDNWTGRILDALERNGLAENTLVVFTSDLGCP